MKKRLLFAFFYCGFILANAQTTVSFRLDASGEDAQVQNYSPNLNQGNLIEYYLGGWTSGTPVIWRQMLKFDLSSIPTNATVLSAHLLLFYPTANLNHSYCCDTSLTHSNASLVQRITSAWSESSVTWNTQPTVTTLDETTIPASTSATESYNLDVTPMVQPMVSTPSLNYGFLLRMVDESPYAQLLFASSDNPDSTQHPVLVVTYITNIAVSCEALRLDSIDEDAQVQNYSPNLNQGNLIEYYLGGWTSGTSVIWRQMLKFNLSSIPTNATVLNARLLLFYPTINLNHSYCCDTSLTHSNASLVQRITSAWSESTVTWNTQPTVTTLDETSIPASVSATESYNLDVTAMVQPMVSTPSSNYGFLLQMADESPYAQLLFASGDNPDLTKHPLLQICYTVPACNVLNLKFFIQGYYQNGGTMKNVLYGESIDANSSSTNVDTVLVELHNTTSPYSVVEAYTGVLQTNGTIACYFSCEATGHSYYIAVKHRNSIQTWSATPVLISASTSYDFTTFHTQAYGNNMAQVEPGKWAFYTGDINQDENIDLTDFPTFDYGIVNGFFGYYASDLNGDGNVDLVDFPLLNANIVLGIFSQHP